MTTMIAARLHAYGQPMTLDRIDVPEPRPTDVLVEVKACGVVPNLARVVEQFLRQAHAGQQDDAAAAGDFRPRSGGRGRQGRRAGLGGAPRRPRLCQSGAVLRLVPDVPQRPGAGLSELDAARLFRPLPGHHARLSLWRARAVHHRAGDRAGQAAGRHQLRGGGADWGILSAPLMQR